MCGEPEHGFERDVPMKAAIVAKDELIEIGVDMLAPQAMIRAQRPSASATRRRRWIQGRTTLRRHFSDNARIVPVVARQPG